MELSYPTNLEDKNAGTSIGTFRLHILKPFQGQFFTDQLTSDIKISAKILGFAIEILILYLSYGSLHDVLRDLLLVSRLQC